LDDARRSLARAQALGEWDSRVTIDRGRVEEQAGFPERARQFWNEVIQLGSGAEAKKAAALIDALDRSG
jgi:hypothetical protein